MRPIDADKLIRFVDYSADLGGLWGRMLTAFKTVIKEVVNVQPTIDLETYWIPTSDRLPEEGQRVLATHLGGLDPSRQVIEHIYSGGAFLLNWEMDMDMWSPTFGQKYMGAVVAWMPLPEPYKEGDAE